MQLMRTNCPTQWNRWTQIVHNATNNYNRFSSMHPISRSCCGQCAQCKNQWAHRGARWVGWAPSAAICGETARLISYALQSALLISCAPQLGESRKCGAVRACCIDYTGPFSIVTLPLNHICWIQNPDIILFAHPPTHPHTHPIIKKLKNINQKNKGKNRTEKNKKDQIID